MDGLFPCRGIGSFGPNHLDPTRAPPALVRVAAARQSRLRTKVRQHCPQRPGVYGMVNPNGELIYIGKAKRLRTRLLSYFRTKSRDAKAGHILRLTRVLIWEYAPSEFAALLRELELIRRWRPRLNVQGQPGRRRPQYVCLGRPPAPYAFLSPQPPAKALAAFGPVPAGWQAGEAVRHLNDAFRLRDCSQSQEMVFADQVELFPIVRAAGCLRYEIGTCLGPCIGACSRAGYMERLRAARKFLAGSDVRLLRMLKRSMTEASAALAFERAAVLRDKWESLHWLHERLKRLRVASKQSAFIYPLEGSNGDDLWYLVQGGRVVRSLPWPRTRVEKQAAAEVIASLFRQQNVATKTLPAGEMDGILLVAAWFRKHPEEQSRILPLREALSDTHSLFEK
jgi:excinuclease ABC subunit C